MGPWNTCNAFIVNLLSSVHSSVNNNGSVDCRIGSVVYSTRTLLSPFYQLPLPISIVTNHIKMKYYWYKCVMRHVCLEKCCSGGDYVLLILLWMLLVKFLLYDWGIIPVIIYLIGTRVYCYYNMQHINKTNCNAIINQSI